MSESSDRCRESNCGSGKCSCGFRSRFGPPIQPEEPSTREEEDPYPNGYLLFCSDCGTNHLDVRASCEPGAKEKYQQFLAAARERDKERAQIEQPSFLSSVGTGCMFFLMVGALLFVILFREDIAEIFRALSDASARTFPN